MRTKRPIWFTRSVSWATLLNASETACSRLRAIGRNTAALIYAPSMVEHSMLSSVSKNLARWCLGMAVMILCGLPGAIAQSSEARSGVSLKLDWDLMPKVGTPGVSRAELLDAGAPELRGRILKVRDQVASLEQSNAEKSSYLNHHEELIQRMRGVVAAQEKVIARLAAEAERPETVAMLQPPVAAPRPAPVPRPQVSTVMAPIHLGPIELPGAVRNYLTEGAFAGILVILLGWALYLRSVARARTAELTILKGGSSAVPAPLADEEPEALEEWPEPEPAPAAKREPAPAPAKKHQPSKPAAAAPKPKRSDSDTAPELEWSETIVRQKADDPDVLAEVDTLIADGDLPKAKQLLDELSKGDGDNPEYRLRLLHVDSALGNSARASEQEQILAKMSQGQLSETRKRIKEIGRGLMPGHPLFDDDSKLEEAKRIMDSQGSGESGSDKSKAPQAAEERKPVAASAQRPQAPPLILDLEVDDETIDFFTDLSFDAGDETDKKG